METSRPVMVKRMPERLNSDRRAISGWKCSPFLNSDRPQVVFDLAQVKHLDAAGVDMLLQCMAEVMKTGRRTEAGRGLARSGRGAGAHSHRAVLRDLSKALAMR